MRVLLASALPPRIAARLLPLAPLAFPLTTALAPPVAAQGIAGRWVYQEGDQAAELGLRPEPEVGGVIGTISFGAASLALEGRANQTAFVVETLDGESIATGGELSGHLEGGTLLVTIASRVARRRCSA